MKIILLGPQGSGKGTQAELLVKQYNLASFAMGDALREKSEEDSQEGKRVKQILLEGGMVPNHITDGLIKTFIDTNENWIIDGYPRNMEQAEFFDQNTIPDVVLVLEISDETAIDRLGGRRVCSRGHNYHIIYKKPKEAGVCDKDGLPLHQREDDTAEAITERLSLYHEKTQPVIDYYKAKVIVIDGNDAIDVVLERILEKLKPFTAEAPSGTGTAPQ